MDTTKPDTEFYSWKSIKTTGAASVVACLIFSVISSVFDFDPEWLLLALCIVISLLIFIKGKRKMVHQVSLAVINGFLIYATAFGFNSSMARIDNSPSATTTTQKMELKKFEKLNMDTATVKAKQEKPKFFLLKPWFGQK